jgi:plasmid stabilization system protein ParE
VKISYRQAASDDVVRQIRYYLVARNVPDVATRFRDAIRLTMQSLRRRPFLGPHYAVRNPQLENLRFWPVAGFEAIGIYYLVDSDAVRVIRILHGKRDVKGILERERLERP